VGVPATVLRVDATNEVQVEAAVRRTADSLGRLDILINMAGIYVKTSSPSGADWSGTLNTNAKSAFLFSIHAAPIMKATGGGRIVNFGDWLPVSARPHCKGHIPYYVSQAAVAALTESLALDLAPEILVNAIAPGPFSARPTSLPRRMPRLSRPRRSPAGAAPRKLPRQRSSWSRPTLSPANASASMVDGTSTNERNLQPRGMALMTCATRSY
jgi:NAD(P)-dependent dehydrogenase (short-subunit alcohol dehydrogenase family)